MIILGQFLQTIDAMTSPSSVRQTHYQLVKDVNAPKTMGRISDYVIQLLCAMRSLWKLR